MVRSRAGLHLVLAVIATFAAPFASAELPVAATDIRDIRGPLTSGGPPPFVLSGMGLLIAGGVVVARRKLRRREAPHPPTAPDIGSDPAGEVDRLAAAYRRGECPADMLCLRLAALVRTALAERSGLPASRLTTEELLEQAPSHDEPMAGKLDLAGRILSFCDLVKFAGHSPKDAEVERALEAARDLLGGSMEERYGVS